MGNLFRGHGAGLSLKIVCGLSAIMALFIPPLLGPGEVSISLQQLATDSVVVTIVPLGMGHQTQQEKALSWLLLHDPIIHCHGGFHAIKYIEQ